jgi:murein L,D-transpeptidase YcbB/YkuD
MEDEVERVVRLDQPVPIYIVYFTAWRSDDGAVHFRDDIYGHDEALWPALRDELAAETEDPAPGPFLAAAYE